MTAQQENLGRVVWRVMKPFLLWTAGVPLGVAGVCLVLALLSDLVKSVLY